MYIVVFNEQHASTMDSKRELNKTELVDLLKTFLVMTEADKSDVFFKKLNVDNRVVLENEILELDKKKQSQNPNLNHFVLNYEEMNEREMTESSSSESGSDSDSSSGSDSDSDF